VAPRGPEQPAATPQSNFEAQTRSEGNPKGLRVATSPAIRKHAKEAGVDLAQVTGTGPGGRILRRDLSAYLADKPSPTAPQQSAATQAGREFEDIKVIGVRRLIAQRMAQANNEIPHFAYIEEIDVTDLEVLRKHLNTRYEQNLTLLPFLGLAIIRALADFPQCNAHYNATDGTLRRFHAVHLGVATQTDQGLKVPVVHGAHALSLWQLAAAMRTAAESARDGTAKVSDLTGSSITLSSLGKLGGIAATPIINYPEVAIVGINKAVQRPVVRDDRLEIRTMMNVSGSFDHRFVDGFDAASFVQVVKANLENPATLWIEGP
jgi:2-oxoisovalerate dehydrogenase E2 component (dihydrolipoyl transacylase)